MKTSFLFAEVYYKSLLPLLLLMFSTHLVQAQLPQCDKIYLDKLQIGALGLNVTATTDLYNYDPSLPVSATNPSHNTIALPTNSGGLTVSEVLGSGNTTLTFYTVVNGNYWYYNPTTLTWTNTGHSTGNTAAVNIASGGGFIYSLVGATGAIYKYNGTQNGSLLVTISDFPDAGPYDIIADCAGNFYVLRFSPQTVSVNTLWLRKYDPSGNLMQQWTVTNPNGYFASGGFGIIGQDIYIDDYNQTSGYCRIATSDISGTSFTVNTETPNLGPYNGAGGLFGNTYAIGDMGSCASSVPVLPTVMITGDSQICSGNSIDFTSTVTNGGPTPHYQWYVNGQPVSGQTNPDFTYANPQDGDVVTCEMTSNEICVSDTLATSNPITISVSPGGTPTFTQVGPYCIGTNIPALPTTSINGISGTWSPSLNNTQTTTYTFTPGANQCATPVTMTVEIDTLVNPIFNQVGPYCSGSNIPNLPTTSMNGISGSWSPAINNTATTTYTFTPNATECGSVASMTVEINSTIHVSVDTVACSVPFDWRGQVVNHFGQDVAQITFSSSEGCDSIISLNAIPAPSVSQITHDLKGCDSLTFQGKTYYEDNNVVEVFKSVLGCDSAIITTRIFVDNFTLNLEAVPNRIAKGDYVNLNTSGTTPYSVISWTPGSLFPDQHAQHQAVQPQQSTLVRVLAQSPNGCPDTASVRVEVLLPSSHLFLPNAFSPNGDGLNDRFGPNFDNPFAVIDLKFAIYNRYGRLIYQSFKATDEGWDGSYRGKVADLGAYFYFLEYSLRDGTHQVLKGEVNLIR